MINTLLLAAALLNGVTSDNRDTGSSVDLLLTNATLVDVEHLNVLPYKNIAVKDGQIVGIYDAKDERETQADKVIDIKYRMVAPGWIDVHHHLDLTLGTYQNTPGNQDTINNLVAAYSPYGVTSVRSAGAKAEDFPMIVGWQKPGSRLRRYMDYYFAGQALVGINTHFYNHKYIKSISHIPAVLSDYANKGVRQVKVYSLISPPMLQGIIDESSRLNLDVFGHIEGDFVSLERAIESGLKGIEHIKTLYLSLYNQTPALYGIGNYKNNHSDWQLREFDIFSTVTVKAPALQKLVAAIKEKGVNITTTLAIYDKARDALLIKHKDKLLREKVSSGYKSLVDLLLLLHEQGVQLQLGTDSHQSGQTYIEELLILQGAGIPALEVFKMASFNGAKALGIADKVGAISVGKQADLIVFAQDPRTNFSAIKSAKAVLKKGRVIFSSIEDIAQEH